MSDHDRCAASDAAVEALWRESWLGSHVRSLFERVHAAWIASRCRRAIANAGLLD